MTPVEPAVYADRKIVVFAKDQPLPASIAEDGTVPLRNSPREGGFGSGSTHSSNHFNRYPSKLLLSGSVVVCDIKIVQKQATATVAIGTGTLATRVEIFILLPPMVKN